MNLPVASNLLTALLQSSLLVTGAWLILLTQRKASGARRSAACRFTMAATLALVAVTIGHTALSITPDGTSGSASAPLPQGIGTTAENILLLPADNSTIENPLTSPAIPLANVPSSGPLMLTSGPARALTAAWLTGATLILMAWISSLAARLTLLRHSKNAAGAPWLQIAAGIKGWPLVGQVRLVPLEITPCVWGIRKTVLALPASAAALPAAKLKLILIHECAHLLRRDPFWQILSRFFLAMLWFHPLAWSIVRRSQAADEQAADDTVLRTQADAPSYAHLLVECARQFSLPPALQTTASAMASPTTLTRRVEAVLNPGTDRRPVNCTSLLTWSAILSLLAAISSYAAPEVSAAPDQEAQERKSEQKLAEANDEPLLPPITSKLQPKLKVQADTIVFPSNDPSSRKTYVLKGSVELRAHDFTISADEVTLEMQPGQSLPGPAETIDPMNLESAVASGSVVVEGKIDGVVLSAEADSMVYTKKSPEPGLILTGWPSLQTESNLIEGDEQNSKISIGPNGRIRLEKCTLISTNQPAKAIPAPTETPIPSPEENTPAVPFTWQPVSLNGIDYLPGSQIKLFYRFRSLSTVEPVGKFQFRSNTMVIRGTKGTNEILVNNVRFLLRHPVLASEVMPMISRQDLSLILDPVIRPGRIEKYKQVTTVVIDPGHGGNDPGASGPQGKEAAYTLDTAQRLQRRLEEAGIKAVLTRTDDRFMSLKERSDFAATQPGAILISLHFNSGPSTEQGVQTFYPDEASLPSDTPEDVRQSFHRACVALATAVHANGLFKLRCTDGGIRAGKFTVISGQTTTPAVLVECGFLSHPEEAARIATESYRQTLAESLAGSVSNYIRAIRGGSGTAQGQ